MTKLRRLVLEKNRAYILRLRAEQEGHAPPSPKPPTPIDLTQWKKYPVREMLAISGQIACGLCHIKFQGKKQKRAVRDHCHRCGGFRGV